MWVYFAREYTTTYETVPDEDALAITTHPHSSLLLCTPNIDPAKTMDTLLQSALMKAWLIVRRNIFQADLV